MKKQFIFAFFIAVLLFMVSASSVFATAYTNSWDLVDSSKHLDWLDNTQYDPYVKDAVARWEAYKSGTIRKTNSTSACDVMVSDYWSNGNVLAYTSSAGYIYLNKYRFDTITGNYSRTVCLHELGHALGLAHNPNSGRIMSAAPPNNFPALTTDDKDSYTAARKKY